MTNIYEQLVKIKEGRYGSDIRFPIHDALVKLADGEFDLIEALDNGEPISSPILSDYDITEELEIIATRPEGALVKQAIYDALYKLSKIEDDKTIITGLTGIDMSEPTEPSGTDYVSGLSNDYTTWYNTDWSTLKTFLEGTELFSGIELYQQDGVTKGLDLYVNDYPFVRFRSVTEEIGGETVYYNQITVYNEDESTIPSYPNSGLIEAINEATVPTEAYRTKNSVLINCLSNAVMFCRNSAGGVSVTFGCGYNLYPTDPTQVTILSDPSSKIVTLTLNSTMSDYAGISHSHSTPESSTVGALTALISEGDNAVNLLGYGLSTGYLAGTSADGVVLFGSKRLYVANSMLAIEI